MCGGGGGGSETRLRECCGDDLLTRETDLSDARPSECGGGERAGNGRKDTGVQLSHLGRAARAALRGLRKVPPPAFQQFFPPHVPPDAAHFEPVSNGGPRTDLPAEECVLLLIHQKARSVCPPVPEVRTARQRGEGRRYRPGRRETCAGRAAERPAGYGARGGTFLGLFALQHQLRFFKEQQNGNVTLK